MTTLFTHGVTVVVYQIFDNETDRVEFGGVPFATRELAQQRIDVAKASWTAKGFRDFPAFVVRESEVCTTSQTFNRGGT
jgi:hypothetical protein